MAAAGSGVGRLRDALAHKDFRVLATSFGIDQLGTWASSVVLLVYVYDRTGSASYLAVATAVRWVPGLLVSGYAGVLADRYDRARLMRLSAVASFVLASGMALLAATDGPLVVLFVLSGGLAVVGAPYSPAAGALTADAVPETDLAAANAVYGLLENLTVVIGPSLGGLLAAGTPAWGFAVNAASFLAAAVLVSRLGTSSRGGAGARGEGLLTQVADGVRALTADPVARTLVLFTLLDTVVYGATSVLYIPISERAGTGSSGYGYLLAGQALGGVVAAVVANRLAALGRLTPVIVGGMFVLALPFAATVAVEGAVPAFALQVVAGGGMVTIDVLALTALQRELARDRLSRVLGLVDTLILAACLVGSSLAAALLRAVGLDTTLLGIGVGFSAVAVLGCRPLLRADRRAAAGFDVLAERVARLERLDLLASASRPSLERMAQGIEVVELLPTAVLLREGDLADALWVVQSGELAVTVAGEVVSRVGPGAYLGEIGLLHHRPRTATVTALSPCLLWRVDGADFEAALDPVGASSSLRSLATSRLARRPSHPVRPEELEPR